MKVPDPSMWQWAFAGMKAVLGPLLRIPSHHPLPSTVSALLVGTRALFIERQDFLQEEGKVLFFSFLIGS